MRKIFSFSTLAFVAVGTVACGQATTEDPYAVTTKEWAGRMACINELDATNEKTSNMPIAAHAPNALFRMNDSQESGSMEWDVTIYTSAGIPWKHKASCRADFNDGMPEVSYLKVDLAS